MKVRFKTDELTNYYLTPLDELKGKLPFQKDIIKQFKKKVTILISIDKLEDLKLFSSLNLEYLKGDRKGDCSIRLNRTYRLIFTPMVESNGEIVIHVALINEISKHYER